MILNKKLLAILAASALSFGMVACDDDSDDANKNQGGQNQEQNNNENQNQNNNNNENQNQNNNNNENQNQNNNNNENQNQETESCTDGALKCTSLGVSECKTNKWTLKEKCGDKTCQEDGGKASCVGQCKDGVDADSCTAGGKIKRCIDDMWVELSCDPGNTCKTGGKCETDAVTVVDTAIGKACTCLSDDCTFSISGKELKGALSTSATGLAKSLAGLDIEAVISDNDQIVAPNFFSATSQAACAGVVAPAGMTVGCLRDATIDFSGAPGIIKLIKEEAPKVMDNLTSLLPLLGAAGISLGDFDLSTLDIDAVKSLLVKVGDLLAAGIDFKAKNGYCMAATIDIQLSVEMAMITNFINMDNVNAMIGKINTGDYSKVVPNSCPEGSSMISFGVKDETEGTGSANVGFAACFKSCKSDDDCRKADGYSCVDIESDTGIKSVCFDKANMDYFENMTNMFNDELDKLSPAEE